MSVVPFCKMSPGGNTTILVLSPAPSPSGRVAVASELMKPLHLGAEQVGFVDLHGTVPYLEMMGGEFCGNAARALAAYLALECSEVLVPDNENSHCLSGAIDVSGAGSRLGIRVILPDEWDSESCEIERPVVDASVEMPVSASPSCCQPVSEGMDIVHLEGITHVLLDSAKNPMPKNFEDAATDLRYELGLTEHDAVGCIWYGQKGEGFAINPVVWVRATGTTHYETACGSGTIALGLRQALLYSTGFDGHVLQPSGQSIRASVTIGEDGNIQEAWIGGPVRLIAKGDTYLFASEYSKGR